MTLESRREERSARLTAAFERPMLVVALLVVPAIAIEHARVGADWQTTATVMNWLIWSAFATEFLVLLAVAPNRRHWLRTHPLDIAIVFLTPPFGPAALQSGRVLRLLRLIRLVRLAKLTRDVFSLDGVLWCAVIAFVLVLASGAAMVAVEGSKHHPALTTVDGLWWAMTTVTTVGYGDVLPVTTIGRLLAMFIMVVGLGFIAIVTGAIAENYAHRAERAQAATTDDVLAAVQEVSQHLRGISERLDRLEAPIGPEIEGIAPGERITIEAVASSEVTETPSMKARITT